MGAELIKQIHHLGIAVPDIESALAVYRDLLGLKASPIEEHGDLAACLLAVSDSQSNIELLQPLSESGPIAKFLAKRGPGIHHIALETEDIRAALHDLQASGIELIDEEPRRGLGNSLIAFLHPGSTGGVLIELCQR